MDHDEVYSNKIIELDVESRNIIFGKELANSNLSLAMILIDLGDFKKAARHYSFALTFFYAMGSVSLEFIQEAEMELDIIDENSKGNS